MNALIKYFLMFLTIGTMTFTSCNDDDVEIPNEEELITTLSYTLTPATGNPVILIFQDLDGDGGNDPVITNGTLEANTEYNGSLELLNESESPAENITEEIEEEAEEHQFFFSSTVPGLSVAYDDTDSDQNPVGISTILTTGDAGSGTLRVILRHEPDKSANGVSTGDITNAGGETDIEVVFEVTVQ